MPESLRDAFSRWLQSLQTVAPEALKDIGALHLRSCEACSFHKYYLDTHFCSQVNPPAPLRSINEAVVCIFYTPEQASVSKTTIQTTTPVLLPSPSINLRFAHFIKGSNLSAGSSEIVYDVKGKVVRFVLLESKFEHNSDVHLQIVPYDQSANLIAADAVKVFDSTPFNWLDIYPDVLELYGASLFASFNYEAGNYHVVNLKTFGYNYGAQVSFKNFGAVARRYACQGFVEEYA